MAAANAVANLMAPAPLGHGVYSALDRARLTLHEAELADTAEERYALAHVAALRMAAAVLAARPRLMPRRGPRNAWSVLTKVAPELGDWAAFFAAGAAKRAAAEARIPGAVTNPEADDLLRDAERFLLVIERVLELPPSQAA
ncbi:SAV_6107 family HEPN domain-containing protein [Flindersiella endophytica]